MTAKRLIRSIDALLACARGSIAVELGLLAPVAATILIGLFEFTGAFEQSMDLATAARAGVEYAVKNPTDTTGIENAAIASGAIAPTDLTVTVSQFCECPDGTSIGCGDSCTSGAQSDIYMRVALAQPAKSLMNLTGLLAGRTVSASATLRLR